MEFVSLLLLGSLSAVAVAFVLIPRWCLRSISRHKLWEIRDGVVDAIFHGDLPSNEITWGLVSKAESAIRLTPDLTMGTIVACEWTQRTVSNAVRKELGWDIKRRPESGLSADHLIVYRKFERSLEYVLSRQALWGSWPSLIVFGLLLVKSLIESIGKRSNDNFKAVVTNQTNPRWVRQASSYAESASPRQYRPLKELVS